MRPEGSIPWNFSAKKYICDTTDYIAGGSALDIDKGVSILLGDKSIKYNIYELEYFKYWITVRYLFDHKKINVNDLMRSSITLNDSLVSAIDDPKREKNEK